MQSSSAYQTGQATGTIVAFLVIYGFILALGWVTSRWRTRRNAEGKTVRWPIFAALILILLLQAAQLAGQAHAQVAAGEGAEANILLKEIDNGPAATWPLAWPEKDVNDYNAGVRDGFVEAAKKKSTKITPESIKVMTTIVSWAPRTVLRTDLFAPNIMAGYQIVGRSGDRVVTLLCVAKDLRPFDFDGSACAVRAKALYAR